MGFLRLNFCLICLLVWQTCNPCVAFLRAGAQHDGLKVPTGRRRSSCATEPVFLFASNIVSPAIDIREEKLKLSSGVDAQVLSCVPPKGSRNEQPPLVFIHGSFHAAWCWTERYFPFFVSRNYPVCALSLRGTGGTFAGENVKKVKIGEHVSDLSAFLNEELPKLVGGKEKPVLLSHSFGGLAVMKYLELNPDKASSLGGIITMCSVPPSGNGKMTMRYMKRSLVDSWKITAGFAMKQCIGNTKLCRQLFFGGEKNILKDGSVDDFGVSDDDIELYQSYFKRDTEATIDLGDLVKQLPSDAAVEGRAPFLSTASPPCLVIGAERDFIVDSEGVDETATYFGVDSPVFIDSPHDVMLGRNWQNGASVIHEWIQQKVSSK